MSTLAIVLLLLGQVAPAVPLPMLVTPEGVKVEASSRPQDHPRQIEVARQLWKEVCVDRPYGTCAAPDHYVFDVEVSEEAAYHCSGVLRLARTAPEYPAGAGSLPGVQFHCFGAGAREERVIMTIRLPDADSIYLDWPPMPALS